MNDSSASDMGAGGGGESDGLSSNSVIRSGDTGHPANPGPRASGSNPHPSSLGGAPQPLVTSGQSAGAAGPPPPNNARPSTRPEEVERATDQAHLYIGANKVRLNVHGRDARSVINLLALVVSLLSSTFATIQIIGATHRAGYSLWASFAVIALQLLAVIAITGIVVRATRHIPAPRRRNRNRNARRRPR